LVAIPGEDYYSIMGFPSSLEWHTLAVDQPIFQKTGCFLAKPEYFLLVCQLNTVRSLGRLSQSFKDGAASAQAQTGLKRKAVSTRRGRSDPMPQVRKRANEIGRGHCPTKTTASKRVYSGYLYSCGGSFCY
jgi:hypothetical protein